MLLRWSVKLYSLWLWSKCNHFQMENSLSRSGSRSSSVCELEKDFNDMEIMKSRTNRRNVLLRTSAARKAKRVRFFRNGDKFYSGVIIPVLPERYRCVIYPLIRYIWRVLDLVKLSLDFHFHTYLSVFQFNY